jgi:hypothetical protein
VKSVEASERGFSEFYKESTVELAIEQITPAKIDGVSYVIMNRGLLRLNDHTVENPLKAGPEGDEAKNIRDAMRQLLINGSAPASLFYGDAMAEESNSSLRAWASNLNSSLRSIGVSMNEFEVSNFAFSQNGYDSVNYSFDLKLGLKDYTNTSAVSRTYHIANQISLSGLVDPALSRSSMDKAGEGKTIYRQFFFRKDIYPDHNAISVDKIASVSGGQGWVYGPLALASGSIDKMVPNVYDMPKSKRTAYILVGTYEDISALTPDVYEEFAGLILTAAPDHPSNCSTFYNEQNTFNPIKYSGKDCTAGFDYEAGAQTGLPFIVAPGFNPASSDVPVCPLLSDNTSFGKCVLMLNKYLVDEVANDAAKKLATGGAGLYDVESIRDFTMCGYYTHNEKAPSYFQRLLVDSYSRNDTDFGIETFVIGNYANDYKVYDNNSRLDRELLNSTIEGIKVRGLPGCRSFSTCADSPPTGIFEVSINAKSDYGLDSITCDNGAARCDE